MTVTSRKYFSDWFVANGVNKDWGFDFTILSQDDVIVQVRDGTDNTTIVDYTTDLGFYPAEDFASGTVRYPIVAAALPVGKQVRILREVAYFQLERIGKEGKFLPQTHEKAFDRVTILTQQVDDNLERAVKVQVGGTAPELTTGISDGAVLMKQGAFIIEGPHATSISSAQGYAESAESARDLAQEYAQNPEDVEVSTGGYSALHWSAKANFAKTAAEAARDAATATLADSVRFGISQNKTLAEKGQARANIDGGVLAGFRNKIINGGMQIAQRSTGAAIGNGFLSDRWYVTATGVVQSLQTLSGAERAITGFDVKRALSIYSAAANEIHISQGIEGVETLAGKKATLTFFAKGSVAGMPISALLRQSFGTGGAPSAQVDTPITLSATQLPTGMTKITGLVDIPPIAGKTLGSDGNDALYLVVKRGSGVAGNINFTKVSLVEGDATAEDDPFSPRHLQQELALCQRYCWKGKPGDYFSQFVTEIDQAVSWPISFPVTMRAVPAVSIAGTYSPYGYSSVSVDFPTRDGFRFLASASRQEKFANINMTGAYFVADAEL